MFRKYTPYLSILFVLLAGITWGEKTLEDKMLQSSLKLNVHGKTEGVLLDELTAKEQAEARARSRSAYGFEFRPSVTDSDVGLALRIYLPDRWSQNKLRDQLTLVAKSEQLRIATLEWQSLMTVYRDFCEYRKLKRQLALLTAELKTLEPYLEKADQHVEQNLLSIIDRAKLRSSHLALLNDQDDTALALIDVQYQLRLMLGSNANLETLAAVAIVEMPDEQEASQLMRYALSNRSDYRHLDANLRAMSAAENVALSEDGFRLKYLQPEYNIDYLGGDNSWRLSAAFILPWGTKNPDIAVYQQEQQLALSAMNHQRQIIRSRLQTITKAAKTYHRFSEIRDKQTQPVIESLMADLEKADTGQLAQFRELMPIRRQLLDTQLQDIEVEYSKELVAVDLANELGTTE